jgi:hypothetical protein
MDPKDKAFKTAAAGIAFLAIAMVAYYWVSWKTHHSENEVNLSEKAEAPKEDKGSVSELAGIYSSSNALEAQNHRFAFFSLNMRDDGSGYFGTAKVDPIGSETESSVFMNCDEVNVTGKDFFMKCNDANLGQISFSGQWSKVNGVIQVSGQLLWSKGGTEIANKTITLTKSQSQN